MKLLYNPESCNLESNIGLDMDSLAEIHNLVSFLEVEFQTGTSQTHGCPVAGHIPFWDRYS